MSAQTDRETAMVALVMTVGEVVQTLGSVPSGHLYARVMQYLSFTQYQSVIASLKYAKLIEEKNNELHWIGPVKR